jgi:hypothetical protein
VDGALAGGNHEKPFENVGDAPGTVLWMGLLDGDDTLLDFWSYGRLAARPRLRRQPFDTASTVCSNPAPDGVLADAELLADQ